MEVHPVGRVVFVYFLLEDKQMTNRGDGKTKRAEREEPKNQPQKERNQSRNCKLVWSAPPVSVLMWVYVLSVAREDVALQRFKSADV